MSLQRIDQENSIDKSCLTGTAHLPSRPPSISCPRPRSWCTFSCGRISLFYLLLAILLVSPPLAQAQQSELQPVVSVQELEDFAASLEDKAARDKLISSIRALAEVKRVTQTQQPIESSGARLIADLSANIRQVSQQVLAAAKTLGDVPVLASLIAKGVSEPETRRQWLGLMIKVTLILLAGGLAQFGTRFLLSRPRRILEERVADTFWVRLPLLAGRTLLDIVPLAAFAVISYAVTPFIQPTAQARVIVLALINAYLITSGVLVVARMLLAPTVETLRILPLSNISANYLFIWVRRLTGFSVLGFFFTEAALLLGLSISGHTALLKLLGLIITGLVVIFVLQNRIPLATKIRGDGKESRTRALRNRFADVWHVLVSIYAIAFYAVWAFGVTGGFEYLARASTYSVIIVVAARMIATGLDRAVVKGFAISKELSDKFPTLEERANRYLPGLRLGLRWVITLIAALAVLETWGVNAYGLLDTSFGKRMVEGAFSIIAVILFTLVFWEILNSSIERYLSKSDFEGNIIPRSPRARTLLPLLRKVIFTMLAVMVTLMVLAELGIEIGPLLAGAGVIGLAIGFGAQTLVKDIITGLFILMEDTIAVGDYVEVGKHEGDVESLSIRTISLRDPAGSVHTVPFSEVSTVLNYTKDYSNVVLNIGISYRESVDDVIKVLEKLGQEMADDPVLGRDIITPLFVQGLQSLDDSAVIIRARIKVTAGTQWGLKREFNRLMKNRFDELGIEIPFPQRTLTFAENSKEREIRSHDVTENVSSAKQPMAEPKSKVQTVHDKRNAPDGADGG